MNESEETVNFDGYSIIKSLSKNDFNEILLATRLSDGQKVVIKQSLLPIENLLNSSNLGHEYEMLKDLDHPGIPRVYGILFDGKTVAMVQEFIEGTDLRKQIFKKKINRQLAKKELLF